MSEEAQNGFLGPDLPAAEETAPGGAAKSPQEEGRATAPTPQEIAALKEEYPAYAKGGALPDEILRLRGEGMGLLEACRLHDLRATRERLERLRADFEAEKENRRNASATTGSVAGGDAVERGYYSSKEWDALPERVKAKLIRNGKIFDYMKKWGGKE